MGRWISVLLLSVALWPATARARPYEDTKKRFRLELADGWELAPQPGDMNGMVFRHLARARGGDKLAIMMVHVDPGGSEDAKSYADRIESDLSRQRGFARLGEKMGAVGGAPAVVREYKALISSKPKLEKTIRASFFESKGRLFFIHVEATPKELKRLDADVERMLASFEAIAGGAEAKPSAYEGRTTAAQLVGRWVNDDGLMLVLGDDGSFALAEAAGRYEVQESTLTLIVTNQGRESFTFAHDAAAGTLTLSSPNLDGPMTYRRWTSGQAPPKSTTRPSGTKEPFVGRWSTPAPNGALILELRSDHGFSMGTLAGQWSRSDDRLVLTSKTGGEAITYRYHMVGAKLVLVGGDLEDEVVFSRLE